MRAAFPTAAPWRRRGRSSSLPIIVVFLLSALGGRARAASTATLAGIDVFGTDRFAAAGVEAKFGEGIRAWVAKRNEGLRAGRRAAARAAAMAEELRRGLESDIKDAWDLGWVRLSWQDYYESEAHTAFITVDVVERADLRARMPFHPPPTKTFPDPDGLLALWRRFNDRGWALIQAGQMSVERADCKGFYCQWGSQPADLQAMEDKLADEAGRRQAELARIAQEDREPEDRADAVYALSYIHSGNELSHFIAPSLEDPDVEVRAAAMKVFADLAVYHKDVYLPMDRIAAMLDYPTVEDRSRALAVLVGMADEPAQRAYLLDHAAERVLALLRLRQPANHDLAYTFLGLLSKESFPADDFDAWKRWVARARESQEAAPRTAKPGEAPAAGPAANAPSPSGRRSTWRKWLLKLRTPSAPAPSEPAAESTSTAPVSGANPAPGAGPETSSGPPAPAVP